MNDNRIDVSDLNMSEEQLFAHLNHDELESEKITAPRYSYWASVFRVFFRKKINTVLPGSWAPALLVNPPSTQCGTVPGSPSPWLWSAL